MSPEMAGTVKLPELALAGELAVERGDAVACVELFGLAGDVAVAEGVAECRCVGDAVGDSGVLAGADGDDAGVAARAADEPLEAAGVEAAEGFDPLAPQAVRPAPPMTAAMITAVTPWIRMLLPLRRVTRCYRR